jgi:hypothetical protein
MAPEVPFDGLHRQLSDGCVTCAVVQSAVSHLRKRWFAGDAMILSHGTNLPTSTAQAVHVPLPLPRLQTPRIRIRAER